MSIYRGGEERRVRLAPGFEAEVLSTIRALTIGCKENVLMLEIELRRDDPEVSARCGALNGRVEVYAIPIPECRRRRLVASLAIGADAGALATLHGVVSATAACHQARRLAERQLGLAGAVWEPAA